MKKIKSTFLTLAVVATALSPGFLFAQDTASLSSSLPTEKDIIAKTEPGVVRILFDIKGDIVVEPFDFETKTLKFVSLGLKKETIPIDTTFSGTGFVVSPDGYIVTNAHVVTPDTIRPTLLMSLFQSVLFQKVLNKEISENDIKTVVDRFTSEDLAQREQRAKEGMKFIVFKDIKTTITVFNPATKAANLDGYRKDGFPATMVGYPIDYIFNDKDVAIIHIDKTNLPALSLAEKSSIEKGDKLYTFGFPATADINDDDLLSATFTNGSVSSYKDSSHKDFKIIQTNAKIAEGSSGSPMLNDRGEVVGIITYQSGDQSVGDNFGFAIPMEVTRGLLTDKNVTVGRGEYQRNLEQGLALKNERHCKNAIESFNQAKTSTDPDFFEDSLD
ncbi:MAG: hypothetical protein COZ49_03895 [Candidatus Yonathbacteria bacterium CG_4_10_14_3_um_filter_47_65]|uniref:Serine protease n=1 Tax=Candidatus Nomurabacteria bacterium CG1_02_47_685 TaxID=1805282 RepID=A0A1J4VDX0_9BACT|nr:MAG: hypothetical protein AUJ44_00265 [Candidatus Nomurabacteria bacterium CG1_02_47_685]PIX56080.1 MAG: hypothetical protein COZ49_03895 [Candidatus Yonathbacteria bacterium CG_4_10_14_3_um_filter_47_65]PJC20613.1 MAG: hypothetical protein CO061_02045 [Candidatus Yonathbacteria bacterium CG_4_9_14_0_2_um_filter_47_74]PJC67810.1 MAG: hypothetical protein CO016_00010 [Candidatus Yonathbacteria bacterium CG_4_8_14_3_um_filter_46_25]